jgi:hypothetical protein
VQCKKPKEAEPKYCNCGEDHPANYRGCIVAKKIQAVRKITTKLTNPSKQKSEPAAATRNEKLTTKPTTSNAQTYADKVKVNLLQPQKRHITSKTKNDKTFPLKDNEMSISKQLMLILEKLDKQERTNK